MRSRRSKLKSANSSKNSPQWISVFLWLILTGFAAYLVAQWIAPMRTIFSDIIIHEHQLPNLQDQESVPIPAGHLDRG